MLPAMTSQIQRLSALTVLSGVVGMLLMTDTAAAQTLSGDALVAALRQGGYVIVMRHASAPTWVPDQTTAHPGNPTFERQLDDPGQAKATAMGKAMRDLRIPIGDVLTSPTFRARETVQLAQWPNPRSVDELGDGGQSMQTSTAARVEWLKKRVTQAPVGANTLIVTHVPNIAGAFPGMAAGLTDGEAMILAPGASGVALVARVKMEEWSQLVH